MVMTDFNLALKFKKSQLEPSLVSFFAVFRDQFEVLCGSSVCSKAFIILCSVSVLYGVSTSGTCRAKSDFKLLPVFH